MGEKYIIVKDYIAGKARNEIKDGIEFCYIEVEDTKTKTYRTEIWQRRVKSKGKYPESFEFAGYLPVNHPA